MGAYDSDSSGEENFTETNVLLGYASKDADDDTITRLGGQPDWLSANKPPSAALARCKVCKDLLVLLLQLNGELPERFPDHERRLYVFACRRASCRRKEGSVRALRGIRVLKESAVEAPKEEDGKEDVSKSDGKGPAPAQPKNLGESLFGARPSGSSTSANPFSAVNANPFSAPGPASTANPFSSPSSNPFASPKPTPTSPSKDPISTLPKTFKDALSLNNDQAASSSTPPPPEPWPPAGSPLLPQPYPVSFLSEADYETLDPPKAAKIPANARMDIDDDGAAGGSGGKDDKEIFESSMDAQFQKFADRIGQNPEQCIRYEFGGIPLLYSKDDAVGKLLGAGRTMPRCGTCGAGRVFEVQLTPQAITELEGDDTGLDGMDWGTVIVGVCERDCRPRGVEVREDGYLEEWVGVQWEELVPKK